MGHIVDYLRVDEKNNILKAAADFAWCNVDREENWNGSYNNNQMHIHDDVICDSWDDAVSWIEAHDRGWYDDHAVQYRKEIPPTAAMKQKLQQIKNIRTNWDAFLKDVQLKNRKSAYVTCPKCGSKFNIQKLAKYHGSSRHDCLVCRTDLWSESTKKRNRSFQERYDKAYREYQELERTHNQAQSKNLGWCVKVEVHC